MKRLRANQLLFAMILLMFSTAVGAVDEIDKAMEAIKQYSPSQNPLSIRTIEQLIRQTADNDQKRRQLEGAMIKLLESNATLYAKEFVCQKLAQIGSMKCVPPLEAMLRQESTGAMACYALRSNPSPQATEALRRSLTRAPGSVVPDVISALGNRRDISTTSDIIRLLHDKDPQTVNAALNALGRMADSRAAEALKNIINENKPQIRSQAVQALLHCTQSLAADGQSSTADDIYQALLIDSEAPLVRRAALLGLLQRGDAGSLRLVLATLKGDDVFLKDAAIANIHLLQGDKVVAQLLNTLDKLNPSQQAVMMEILVERQGPALRPQMHSMAGAKIIELRLTALKALGRIGDRSSTAILIKAIDSGPAEKQAALASLRQLEAPGVNSVIINALPKQPASVRIDLMPILVDRQATDVLSMLFEQAADSNRKVATAAYKALGSLAGKERLAALLDCLLQIGNDKSLLNAAERALLAVAHRSGAEDALTSQACDKLTSAQPVMVRQALLHMLGRLPNTQSFTTLNRALHDKDKSLRDLALRQLAAWPNIEALPILEKIFLYNKDKTWQTLALRGYVRLLGKVQDMPVDNQIAKFRKAMEQAAQPDDKKTILSGLSDIPHPDAVKLALEALQDEAVRSEASHAIVRLAPYILGSDRQLTTAALKQVVEHSGNSKLKQQADILLSSANRLEDFVCGWQVSPVYALPDKKYNQLMGHAFDPEKAGAQVHWRPAPATTNQLQPMLVDLAKLYPGRGDAAVYLRTAVYSPVRQEAILKVGSDDGIKVWINSKAVHENNVGRGIKIDEDKVEVILNAGWNRIVAKVIQSSGPWGLCLRLQNPDDSKIDGLLINAFGRLDAPVADTEFFDGKTLKGWQGQRQFWRVEDGAIVGHSAEPVTNNQFIFSNVEVKDFYLSAYIKQSPHASNGGVQFRSRKKGDYHAYGYQFDVGKDFWGRLYHEGGRGKLVWTDHGERAVKPDEWNHCEILAVGPNIWTMINGQLSTAYHDPAGERAGYIGLQIHQGSPQTVQYKLEKLIHNPAITLAGMTQKQLMAALQPQPSIN